MLGGWEWDFWLPSAVVGVNSVHVFGQIIRTSHDRFPTNLVVKSKGNGTPKISKKSRWVKSRWVKSPLVKFSGNLCVFHPGDLPLSDAGVESGESRRGWGNPGSPPKTSKKSAAQSLFGELGIV